MKTLRRKMLLTMLVILTIIATAIPAFAKPHEIPYDFNLQTGGANSYLAPGEARYRETLNTSNTWMVNMKEISKSDPNGKATYWLARRADHDQVSKAHTIHSGTGQWNYSAYSAASEQWIVLGADNDDMVACYVKGVWDEETD